MEAAGADSRHWVPSGRSNGEKDQITARFYWWSLEEYRFAVAMVKDSDRVDSLAKVVSYEFLKSILNNFVRILYEFCMNFV